MAVLVQKRIIKGRVLIIFLLGAALLFSLAYLNEGPVARRITTMGSVMAKGDALEDSLATRLRIWQGAWALVRERPFTGVGIGNFDAAFYRYRPAGLNARAVYAHNEYLHAAAEMGLLAAVLLAGMLVVMVIKGFGLQTSVLAVTATTGVLSLALHALSDFNFHIMSNALLLMLVVAYIESHAKRRTL
jgi:O-antigen ligase